MPVEIMVICMIRGCNSPAQFYMRRVKRDGTFQSGLVCNRCDIRYGAENLRLLEKEA